jgi:Protein of unknown function (DUF1559)
MTQTFDREGEGRRRRWAKIGLIVGLLGIPACFGLVWLQAARESENLKESRNHIYFMQLALLNYHEMNGYFPAGTVLNKDLGVERRLSWQAEILPYLESIPLYEQIDFGKAWDDPKNREAVSTKYGLYWNGSMGEPEKDGFAQTHYVGLAGVGADGPMLPVSSSRAGCFAYDRSTRLRDITDGASNTAMISEVSQDHGPWAAGGRATIRSLTKQPYFNGPDGLGGGHKGGWLVGFADAKVWFISEKVDPKLLEAVMTIRGGEIVNANSIGVRQSPSSFEAAVETTQSGPANSNPDNRSSTSQPLDVKVQHIVEDKIDAATKIVRLQQLQREHSSVFSWTLHNELRDLYGRVNKPEAALKESDVLLSQSIMDGYILNTLSEWKIDKAPKKAIQNLLRTAKQAKDCHFVEEACWLEVGDLYQQLGDPASAKVHYHKVLARDSITVSQYQKLARERLAATAMRR